MTTYVLTIFTWPTASGSPCEPVESVHSSAAEAIASLDSYQSPYWLATLASDNKQGQCWPCREDGSSCYPPDFRGAFQRQGTNQTHPARLAMISDWPRLIHETREIHVRDRSGGLLRAARAVLAKSHPLMTACAVELAQAAYGPSDHHDAYVPAVADVLTRMREYGETQDEAVEAMGGMV